MNTPEYPLWQRIDIHLSKEYDAKPIEWQKEHDKGDYLRDEKNRARAEKELN